MAVSFGKYLKATAHRIGGLSARYANVCQRAEMFPRLLRPALLNIVGHKIHPSVRIQASVNFRNGFATIGPGSYLNNDILADATAPISIGANVFIGPRANLITASHFIGCDTMRAGGRNPLPIVICDGVWIGAAATILPGIKVADGCVVAAGALVNKATEPNGLYAGVPAKRIRDI